MKSNTINTAVNTAKKKNGSAKQVLSLITQYWGVARPSKFIIKAMLKFTTGTFVKRLFRLGIFDGRPPDPPRWGRFCISGTVRAG